MPALNLHRRTSPRIRPTIRLVSSAELHNGLPQHQPKIVAENALQKSISPALAKLRRAQRALVGKRYFTRAKRGISFLHTSTKGSLHHTSINDSASKLVIDHGPSGTLGNSGGRYPPPRKSVATRRPNSPYPLARRQLNRHKDPSKRPRPNRVVPDRPRYSNDDMRCSVVRLPEGLVPNGMGRSGLAAVLVDQESHPSTDRMPKDYHVGGIDGTVDPRKGRSKRGEIVVTRRDGPLDFGENSRAKCSKVPVPPVQASRRRRESTAESRKKRFGVVNPYSDTVRRGLSQQHSLSSLAHVLGPVPPASCSSSAPSRTPSEKRALNRFARELGRYAKAFGAEGRKPVFTPTPLTESHTTPDTIPGLLPYRDQFDAAGLAVTSKEQKLRYHGIATEAHDKRPRRMSTVPHPERFVVDITGAIVDDRIPEAARKLDFPPAQSAKPAGYATKRERQMCAASDKALPARKVLPWLRKNEMYVPSHLRQGRRIPRDRPDPSVRTPLDHLPSHEAGSQDNMIHPRIPLHLDNTGRKVPQVQTSRPSPTPCSSGRDKPLPRLPVTRPQTSQMEGIDPTCSGLPSMKPPDTADGSPQCWLHCPPHCRVRVLAAERNHTQPRVNGLRSHMSCPCCLGNSCQIDVVSGSSDERQAQVSSSPAVEAFSSSKSARDDAPKLPAYNWKSSDDAPSSLQKAVDAVIAKLFADDSGMEHQRTGAHPSPTVLTSRVRQPKLTSRSTELMLNSSAGGAALSSAAQPSTHKDAHPDGLCHYQDRGLSDKDILIGLKLAISVASDEELDIWVREKTGLRLRRFLADLKSIQGLDDERREGELRRAIRKIKMERRMRLARSKRQGKKPEDRK